MVVPGGDECPKAAKKSAAELPSRNVCCKVQTSNSTIKFRISSNKLVVKFSRSRPSLMNRTAIIESISATTWVRSMALQRRSPSLNPHNSARRTDALPILTIKPEIQRPVVSLIRPSALVEAISWL
ncbi:hypothetical protein SLEP1_g15839 [Rubroshorea leprosula]|uniref:Uncharacterized protein n=1 Tax=Rubroshorea leprosula TaxID=152421 RepID=A0AAV5IY43_9ROSI|nr:hypothetical protein SLEP1_g15839 [Rubroshorea leprosula]